VKCYPKQADREEAMKINTRDFGSIDIDEKEIITFQQPIYGFEELRHYVLLYDDEVGGQFMWLQSTEEQNICFILLDPALILNGYPSALSTELTEGLHKKGIKNPVFRVIAVVRNDMMQSTVNLKSPIVIDAQSKYAAQVILDDDYPVRKPLLACGKGAL
jgi:flagellar assembly factor FliW